ncbi:hypothetical protein J2801_005373 [Paraburkholderia phenoliruptrix]|uniref:hypothetical protein n=1 Tax=Paraburkholderia phenoliruptrix TaxID=252970 RepID=UPI002861FA12|nr:hypothetical protein [Paraburkholderia phenoliruptrix]MDR6423076.1 hypothetical protein [Paraburkholderia phenoliruptrix]
MNQIATGCFVKHWQVDFMLVARAWRRRETIARICRSMGFAGLNRELPGGEPGPHIPRNGQIFF